MEIFQSVEPELQERLRDSEGELLQLDQISEVEKDAQRLKIFEQHWAKQGELEISQVLIGVDHIFQILNLLPVSERTAEPESLEPRRSMVAHVSVDYRQHSPVPAILKSQILQRCFRTKLG